MRYNRNHKDTETQRHRSARSRIFIRAPLCLCVSLSLWFLTSAAQTPGPQSIDKFFSDFTAEWMRVNPSAATATRYFAGNDQDRLER